MADSSDDYQFNVIENATPPPAEAPPRMKAVTEFSFGRLMQMVLAWIGVPAALVGGMMLPSGGPSADFLQAWFYLGLAVLFLNASGLVTLRRRKLVPDDKAG